MRLLVVYCFILSLPLLVTSSSYSQCFEQHTRKAIGNYLPLAEYKLVSLATCLQNCIFASGNRAGEEAICKSVTYDSKTHNCMLFDHNGYKVPAILHPAIGIDLFTRNIDSEECRGPPRRMKERKDGNPNFIQLENNLNEQRSNNITSFRTHDTVPSKHEDFVQDTIGDFRTRIPKKPRAHAAPIRQIDGDLKVPEIETTTKSTECMTAYYVVLGTEIQKGEDTEDLVQNLADVDQGDCARLCSENHGFEGKPFECKSLNYYPETRKCELYSIQVEPNGPGKFLANPNTIYSEKFCMPPTRKVCQSDEVFILHVQKMIVGHRLSEKMADGITPCLGQCLAKDQCQSAVYDDNRKRCTLFAVDLSENGRALKETIPGSVAIENPCVDRSAKMRASKTFSLRRKTEEENNEEDNWSACNFKIDGKLYKVRTKGDQLEVRDC